MLEADGREVVWDGADLVERIGFAIDRASTLPLAADEIEAELRRSLHDGIAHDDLSRRSSSTRRP